MNVKNLQEKLSSIKLHAFYGDEHPPRLPKDPSKVLQPLFEWAGRAPFKNRSLIGRKLDRCMPPPPKRSYSAYRLFFEDSKKKLLAPGGKFTRDEIQTVAPTIKQLWLDASNETLSHYDLLAKEDAERYKKAMEEYERLYPECARQLKIKQYQRKAKMRHTKELKKKSHTQQNMTEEKKRVRRSMTSSSKKVSSWLDNLEDPNLNDSQKDKEMDTDTESVHTNEEEDTDDGYHGAYGFP